MFDHSFVIADKYQAGSRNGLAVTEPNKQETHLINEGRQALEHSEVQLVG